MRRMSILTLALTILCLSRAASGQVTLQYKYVPGAVRTDENKLLLTQILTIFGMETKTTADSASTVTTTVSKPDAAGALRIETRNQALRINLSLGQMGMLNYDSATMLSKTDVAQLEPLLKMMEVLAKAKVTSVYDSTGKLTALEGVQDLLNQAPADAQTLLKAEFDLEKYQKAQEERLKFFPADPLQKGDKWQRTETMDLGGGQALKVEKEYEYQGTVDKDGKQLDKIGGKITKVLGFEFSANASAQAKVTKSDLKVADSTESLLFDREQGAVVETTSTFNVKGTVTLSVNGMNLDAQLDLKIESSTKPAVPPKS